MFVIQFASVQIGRQTQWYLVGVWPAQVPVTDMRPLRGRDGWCLFGISASRYRRPSRVVVVGACVLVLLIKIGCCLFYKPNGF